MTSWLGTFALALAFCAALAGTGLWARAAVTGAPAPGRWTGFAPLAGAALAVGVAEWALLTHDFSIRFVAENGSLSTPVYYTVTSLWAAHDGSLLLWVLILTGYLAVVAARRPGPAALHGWATTVLFATTAFFSGLALFTGKVFDVLGPAPTNGPGPNPLLSDHPAMGVHPPLLYTGLLGMAVPFAFAVAALVTGQVGRSWVEVVRPYLLFAWTALTAGIVVGAWWSYAVLGWGGYWAWDPVENASLMPWLVATALVHSVMVQRRRGALPAWNISLAVGAFLLACLGSFLTRSGVVGSVHAFADSAVGPVLLGFLAALGVGVAVLVLMRSDRLGSSEQVGKVLSRGTAILVNNLLLVTLAVTVLIGTLFPLFAQWAGGPELSVGPPYFDKMAVPIALLLLVLMALGPMLAWRGDDLASVARRRLLPVTVGAVVVAVVAVLAPTGVAALLTFGLAAVVVTGVVADAVGRVRRTRRVERRRLAGLVAHVGVAVLLVGVAASSSYSSVREQTLHPGDSVTLAGHTARLVSVGRSRGARAMSTDARLRLTHGSGTARMVSPGLSFYPAQTMTVARPAVVSRPGGDVYLTLLSVDGDHAATVRMAVNPLVGWIWAGGGLMVAGSLLAFGGRRRRRHPHVAPPEPARPEAVVLETARG
jgi:cytochrome c-type biogenesis protein CcmF